MSAKKVCSVCGIEYPATELFCPRDGSPLRAVGAGQSDLVGEVVAERYHVVSKLGDGGMGQVYLAEHVKMGRKIALKVLRPAMMSDADSVARFNREAANASKISHPNVAAVYDFGETPAGVIFIAMEYVDGQSLTKVIEQAGGLPAKRAAEIVRQTGEALAVAHDMGIVHRDLKPDNIMIARTRTGADLVKVVDFGIAKSAATDTQKVTKTGHVVGTPDYMSPEQLAGDKLDARTDIYSLGLVAFNMLTGKLPFPSESAQESMIMRLIDRPKPLMHMRPDLLWPAEVQRVIDKALEREAAQRYQTATEFANDFAAAIDRMVIGGAQTASMEPVQIPPQVPLATPPVIPIVSAPSSPTMAAAPSAFKQRAFTAVGIVGLAAALVAGGALWRGRTDTKEASIKPSGEVIPDSVAKAPDRSGGREGKKAAATGDSLPHAKRSGRSGAAAKSTASAELALPTLQLRVRASDLSPPLRRQVQQAAGFVEGVAIVDNATDAADVVLRSSDDGRLIVERQGVRDAASAKLDTGTIAKTLIPIFRHELTLSVLSALDRGGSGAKLDLQLLGGKKTFMEKDTVRVHIRPEQAGYLTLLDLDPSGQLAVMHPSGEIDLGRIGAGKDVNFDHGEFSAGPPFGTEVMRAIITDKPLTLKREGPVLISIDGPRLAMTICKSIKAAGAQWSTASITYAVRPKS